jgi:hypothetical protein
MAIRLRSVWEWLTPLRWASTELRRMSSFRSASCVMRRAKNAIRNTQYDTFCSTVVENFLQIGLFLCKSFDPVHRESGDIAPNRQTQDGTKPIAGLWPEILSTKY